MRNHIEEEVKREEFISKNSKVKTSPLKLSRNKSRDGSLAGSSRAHSSHDGSFDFADDDFGESEGEMCI